VAMPRLTRLELQILDVLWEQGKASIREIQEAFPEPRPAYTTIQTTVYRLEAKKAVRRVKKISNAHIFEPVVAREVARHRLLDEILSFFGGRALPMMAQLAEAGKLTRDDIRELEKTIDKRDRERTHERASTTSEPRDRSEPAKRRAGERVGESEGASPRAAPRVSAANEPRERSEPAKRRASERVGEPEGRSPLDKKEKMR